MTRPSIHDAAGGMPAFEALAAAHHARCLADPVLEHPFSHTTNPDHVHACFLAALDDAGIPAEPTLRAALYDYMARAVTEVMVYAPYGSRVPTDVTVPRWSWDGEQPARESDIHRGGHG